MNYATAIVQLPLVKETTKQRVRTPEDISRICDDLRQLAQESFHVLCVNAKNYLIDRQMVSMGLVDASLVHAREVLRPAIVAGASAVLLVHNHPSGDSTPSAEDIRITKELTAAGRIVDIKVLDHVIIGRGDTGHDLSGDHRTFVSMREQGLCDFS